MDGRARNPPQELGTLQRKKSATGDQSDERTSIPWRVTLTLGRGRNFWPPSPDRGVQTVWEVTINPFISALAAGNAVIVKPSELAPESASIRRSRESAQRPRGKCFFHKWPRGNSRPRAFVFIIVIMCLFVYFFFLPGWLATQPTKKGYKGMPFFCSHGNCKELYGRQRNPRTSELPTLLVPTLLRDSMILVW